MSNLPPGFVLDEPKGQSQLPAGFVIDAAPKKAESPKPMNKNQAISRGFDVLKGFAQNVGDAIEGDAEFKDVPAWEQYSDSLPYFGGWKGAKVAAAGMFGTDEDKLNSIRKNFPDLEIRNDSNGNPYFIAQQGKFKGQPIYVDDPGLDAGDIVDAIGQGSTYLAGGSAVQAINNPVTRSLAQGGVQTAINVGNQMLAGRENVDKSEAAVAGLFGLGTEAVAPYAGKLFNWAKNTFSNADDQALNVGRSIAQKQGLEMSDDLAATLGKMRTQIDDSVTDDALIAELKHGLKLSRGQATGSPKTISNEQILRNKPALLDKVQQIDDFNQAKVEGNLRNIRSNMFGHVDDELVPANTADVAQDALLQAEKTAKKAYQDAYGDVGNLFVKKEAAKGLPDRLKKAVTSENQWLDPKQTPKTLDAINDIAKNIDSMGDNVSGFSLKAFDNQRKKINNLFSPAMDKTDKRALSIVKDELDNWFYGSVDEQLLNGNREALNKLKNARSLMTEYSKRFNSKEGASKVITKIIKEEKTPEEFSQMLVGVNGASKTSAGNLVKAYKEAVGADSEGFKALQAHVFEKLILSTKGNIKGYEGLTGAFDSAFKVKGKTMMKELFTQDQASSIKSLMRSVNKLIPPDKLKNPSGSGTWIQRLYSETVDKVPVLRGIINQARLNRAHNLPQQPIRIDTGPILAVEQQLNN